MLKEGMEIITVASLWHAGEDVGGRLGQIISLDSHVLVNLYGYEHNPVKCFRSEVKPHIVVDNSPPKDEEEDEVDRAFYDLFHY